MSRNEKKVIMNQVLTICMETIWAILIIVGILILVSIDQTATAILLGVGLAANIVMIINEFNILRIWLDTVEENLETKEDNK